MDRSSAKPEKKSRCNKRKAAKTFNKAIQYGLEACVHLKDYSVPHESI
jgi:hypothetical protein